MPETAYLVMLVFMAILLTATCIILKHKIPKFSLLNYWLKSMLPCILSIIVVTLVTMIVKNNMEEDFMRLVLVISMYLVSILTMATIVILKKEQRIILLAFIIKKINKRE